jgi:hypothetical protein
MRTKLTKRRLWAIENALTLSLAGAIETDHPGPRDYELALQWAREEQEARSKPSVDKAARS